MRHFFLFLLLAIGFAGKAQLVFDTVSSPKQLVVKKLLGEHSGLIIRNVNYTGKDFSLAGFKSQEPTGLIDEGIILSTGNVYYAAGPNQAANTGLRSNGYGDPNLQAIATGVVRDAAVLEFDLLALKDSVRFDYVFASEEYPEYVDKGVNDVFGFFIHEIGGRAIYPKNIAKLPDGRTSVSIDNVNHRRNEEFFLRSDFLSAHDQAFWKANPEMLLRAHYFEFDGFTQILRASLKLKEGRWYHLKIAIADVGDRFYDSAVFLKANSMEASGKPIAAADSIVSEIIKEELPELQGLRVTGLSDISFNLQVNFATDEHKIQESSFQELQKLVVLLDNHPDIKLEIIGHTDNVGTQEKNLSLSINRANAVFLYLDKYGIDQNRMTYVGKGELAPLDENSTEKGRANNRRVEFRMRY